VSIKEWLTTLFKAEKPVALRASSTTDKTVCATQPPSRNDDSSTWRKRLLEMDETENSSTLVANLKKRGCENVHNTFQPMNTDAAFHRLQELSSQGFGVQFYESSAYASRRGHVPKTTEETYLHKTGPDEFIEYSRWDVSD
jgi:hypothetical protein